jgi:hypothetical protein
MVRLGSTVIDDEDIEGEARKAYNENFSGIFEIPEGDEENDPFAPFEDRKRKWEEQQDHAALVRHGQYGAEHIPQIPDSIPTNNFQFNFHWNNQTCNIGSYINDHPALIPVKRFKRIRVIRPLSLVPKTIIRRIIPVNRRLHHVNTHHHELDFYDSNTDQYTYDSSDPIPFEQDFSQIEYDDTNNENDEFNTRNYMLYEKKQILNEISSESDDDELTKV